MLANNTIKHTPITSLLNRYFASAVSQGAKFTPSNETVPVRLEKAAQKYPFFDALLFPNEASSLKFNFKELWGGVSGLASGFVEANIKNQQPVMTNAPQSSEHVFTQMAAAAAGVPFVPVAPESTLSQIGEVLATSSSKALVLAEVKNRVIVDEAIAFFPNLDRITMDEYHRDSRFPELKYIITTSDFQEPGIDLFKEFVLQVNLLKKTKTTPTSLSTLIPTKDGKLVGFTQNSLINTGDALFGLLGLRTQDRVSFSVPFHNGTSYALYLGCLSNGTLVIVPSHSFSVETTLSTIHENKSSMLVVSGEQLEALLTSDKLNKFDLKSLQSLVVCGNVKLDLLKQAEERLKVKRISNIDVVVNTPGQLTGVVFNQSGVGQLLPGIEAKVVDKSGKTVEQGQTGTLYTKGYHVNNNVKDWLDTEVSAKINQDGTITKL
ncbi:hypothetical protein SAMD00019534_070030 [Acytostelium subglobosum LB1]|uniref:hypothetical protein n=1 Tax=Acytostelium subglobosum LB1 TaxID=1410327 RepID=UPI0006450F84|nr:hypothetical protein SAMD00019534_070030 [Acytostelium subglobosum LB1]GAM23828.1 hypothetical protein SAMD00019534_070030 [Acytostelium subglobosum LB1]|eukprot:XP_012753569.1 hypothetical protein SAMD00019534_070030 [Acytostelium subglobosum LB1]